MDIKMKVALKSDVLDLKPGDDGEGLTDKEKRRFVRAGLAEAVEVSVGLKKDDLVAVAKGKGLKVKVRDTKDELIDKIEGAE